MSPKQVHRFVQDLYGGQMHAKRVLSLGDSVLGCVHSATLGVSAIGMGLAIARGLTPKHATKQVDRLLGNKKLEDDHLRSVWVQTVVGQRPEIYVALDWTEFDPDGHATLAAHLVTRHGRATPLHWRTVEKKKLKNQRNHYEDSLLLDLKRWIPHGVRVTVVADRGFGDYKFYDFIEQTLKCRAPDMRQEFSGRCRSLSGLENQPKPGPWIARVQLRQHSA